MKHYTTLVKIVSLSILASFFSLQIVSALTISPARVELLADPGQALNETFTVINDTDSDQTYYTSVEAFDSQGESGTPNFTASKEGLPSWVNVEEKIVLKKGERAKIPYSIAVPNEAEAGGHFAAIFLSTQPPAADGTQVSVGAKVGMLILLRVTGDIKEKGGLVEFSITNRPKLLTTAPQAFYFRFTNDGADRVKPEGNITITNTIGSEVATLTANKNEGNVLPGSTRRFDVTYQDVQTPSVSAPFFEHVKFQKENFSLGFYTATLALNFGNSGADTLSIRYFVFPWQLLILVGAMFLFIILALVFLLKQYNQWIIKQAKQAASKE